MYVFCHNFDIDMILYAIASIVNYFSWLVVVTAATEHKVIITNY